MTVTSLVGLADYRPNTDMATAEELAAIDEVLLTGTRSPRHLLLPVFHSLNDRVGWISRGAINEISQRMLVSPAVAYGVATFYSMLSTEPRPATVGYLCDDVACRLAGAGEVAETLEASWPEKTAHDGAVWERSPCLGLCDMAPAALADGQAVGAAELAAAVVTRTRKNNGQRAVGEAPPAATGALGEPRLLKRIVAGVPPTLDAYVAHGGFAGLRRAAELGPDAIIAALDASGLIGRGGAAFPAAIKWRAVATNPVRPHYLVVNADESETGTFKDRVLLEWDPFAVLEGAAIAALACGVEEGYLYVRGEYLHAAERLQNAITELERRRWLGLASNFRLEIRRGAGAYICGEETALFNSLEGMRGEPRSKPPFPVQAGLFNKPTVINNVETLANVPLIITEGAAEFRRHGTEQSPGTKLFSVSGCVARPGVYEVPFGTALRQLIMDLAGAENPDVIQCGGAAGTFLRGVDLDLPLTFEDLRNRGATIGSGAVMVWDSSAKPEELIRRGAEFFAHESCGQCVPCRVGTQRQLELLDRLAAGEDVKSLLSEVALVMKDASICGLGQTAASMVQSAFKEGVLG